MDTIDEGSTGFVTVSFWDQQTPPQPALPAAVTWTAHDEHSRTELQAETSVTPGETIEIVVPHTVNRILSSSRLFEVRVITVFASYAGGQQDTQQFKYRVNNLAFV